MRRLVAKSLGQRHSIKSGRAFKGRKILEENPNFTVTDCCDNVLAAANVYDVNGGEGIVTLYDLDSDAEIMRLTQNPEFGFPCAVKLFSGMEFVCVAYTSGKLACYRLHDPDSSRRHDLYLTNLQPSIPGSIYCVGGCMVRNTLCVSIQRAHVQVHLSPEYQSLHMRRLRLQGVHLGLDWKRARAVLGHHSKSSG